MKRIYLVRHGRTDWNREEIFRGKMEVPLDDVGRQQAGLVREFLLKTCASRGECLAKIISSPLGRAKEMAEIIKAGFPEAALEMDESFSDIDVGRWGGLYVIQVEKDFPHEYRTWLERPHEMRFPSGESLEEVRERAWRKFLDLAGTPTTAESPGVSESICIVSHRVPLKALILTAIGAPLRSFWNLKVDTGSVSIMEVSGRPLTANSLHMFSGSSLPADAPDGAIEVTVAAVNITSHLDKIAAPDKRDF